MGGGIRGVMGPRTAKLASLLVVRLDECVGAFVLGLFAADLCVHEVL